MMDAIDCILTRRSCRSFTSDSVSKEDISLLLKCAMQSPTADNDQSWKFVVITDRKVLDKIPGIQRYAGFVSRTPMGILVCGDTSISHDMWIQDASIASQTILLAAHAIGLGGCWLAVQPFPEFIQGFRKLLNLPDHIQPLSFLAIGHPSAVPQQVDRFDAKKVHENMW
jgi:nitroreductase